MDTSKIGNPRQQNDNRIAVPDAKQLGALTQELIGLYKRALTHRVERNSKDEQLYRTLAGGLNSPADQEWLNGCLALQEATSAVREAIMTSDLPIWFVKNAEPVLLAPCELDSENIRYGVFKTHEHPPPDNQGAHLWVKMNDWNRFITRLAGARPRSPETGREHVHVGQTFTRDDPATIAPWWTVNQALAWVAVRIPSYVEYIGKLEADEPRNYRPYIVQAICESQVAESDEGKAFMESRCASWPSGSFLAQAGYALLEKILAGDVCPMTRDGKQGRRMRSEDFVGIGSDETGSDWLDLEPQPMFSSAELIAAFPATGLDPPRCKGEIVPPNRQLDHSQIIGQAAAMLRAQPTLSKGSAAASIVADLPPNPRTGKHRDTRHIERLIAHLWEGEV